jgi:hypothetical protein
VIPVNELIAAPVIAALVTAVGSNISKIISWIGEKDHNGKADADAASGLILEYR